LNQWEKFNESIRKIDNVICDAFQKASEWLEEWVCLDCFGIAYALWWIHLGIYVCRWLHTGWHAYGVVYDLFIQGLIFWGLSWLKSMSSGWNAANPARYLYGFSIARVIGSSFACGALWGIIEGIMRDKIVANDLYRWSSVIAVFLMVGFASCQLRPPSFRLGRLATHRM
jgi:hypothetical protein